MKMATIITAYKQPLLIERMLYAMRHRDFHFYLHIDKKVNLKDYKHLFHLPNVFLIRKRIDIRWAGYTMVEALLAGMQQILQSGIHYDFINHLSGQCYPVKPITTIFDFFNQHTGKTFLCCESPPSAWWDEAVMRYRDYHFFDYGFKGGYRLGKIVTKLLPLRKLPYSLTPYGGLFGAYWTISNNSAQYVVDFMTKQQQVQQFFKHSWGPDEILFNTIIMNSDFKKEVINNNYRYIDWSAGGHHPKILTADDFDALSQSDKFFARKFDLTVDKRILTLIDEKILS